GESGLPLESVSQPARKRMTAHNRDLRESVQTLESTRDFKGARLLPPHRQRELAAADALAQALGEAGGGILAIGRDQLVQRREEGNLRQAVAVDALDARFFPGLGEIGEG